MVRSVLIRDVSDRLGVSLPHADTMVRFVFEAIGEALQSGERVTISGFGTFRPKKAARGPTVRFTICRGLRSGISQDEAHGDSNETSDPGASPGDA